MAELSLPPLPEHASQSPFGADHWRTIPGWPGYQVSRDGNVRRIAHAKGAVVGRVLKLQQNRRTRYYGVILSQNCRQVRVDIHRLVALAFLGPPPSPDHVVAHNDGSRTNNCVTNIRWATQQENLADCHRHGTALVGAANPATKLDGIDLVAIHRMRAAGLPRNEIAEGFGVHLRTVFRVLTAFQTENV